jgi:hypothetical protein
VKRGGQHNNGDGGAGDLTEHREETKREKSSILSEEQGRIANNRGQGT